VVKIIDGKAIAAEILTAVAADAAAFASETGQAPALAVVLVGDDPASQVYVRRKLAATRKAGIESIECRLPAATSKDQLLDLIDNLNQRKDVDGILVQLPLPGHLNAAAILDRIDPAKDVDGFHPVNVGRLSTGTDGLVPCTPLGCMLLLDTVVDDYRGMAAVVIGKSNIVGKPVALMLLERECTVTVTHILTRHLDDIVRRADIVVVAAGSPGLVRGEWIKPGAIVIDVGINRVEQPDGGYHLVGDVATDEMGHALAVTPVPGGVGPMTVACLLANTLRAARKQIDAR
jgi:methylenetetrahydrofolate dehydrogenase (NADP+)/methenyltetrahydrofolate cyclohydrolase